MANICICKIPEHGWVVGTIISEKTCLFNRKKYIVLVKINFIDGTSDSYHEVRGSRVYPIDQENITVV